MARPFHFSPFYGVDGSMLMANDLSRVATEQDMNWLFRAAEPEFDRLTMEMCKHERSQGKRLVQWQLEAEMSAFRRIRGRKS